MTSSAYFFFFSFNDPATTEIYTLSLHDALPILAAEGQSIIFISHKLYEVLEIADRITVIRRGEVVGTRLPSETKDRKSTRLNSSHGYISYAVFCLKKKISEQLSSYPVLYGGTSL